jgi:hypothetical protein
MSSTTEKMEFVKYNGKGRIWNFFQRTEDLTKAKCTGCGQEFQTHSKATSTLRRHLDISLLFLKHSEATLVDIYF